MFDNFWVANIVGGPPRRNRHHVQLRVGAVGDVNGGGAGQLCLPRAVGGQQDRGREDAHLLASFSSAVRGISPHRATTYTAWSGAIRPLWDGRFTAHSGAEGGTHRPCADCSNTDVALQHGCYSWRQRSRERCYSPNNVEGAFSEVRHLVSMSFSPAIASTAASALRMPLLCSLRL